MIPRVFLLIACCCVIHFNTLYGQGVDDKKEVTRVIERLFAGMENGDSTLVSSCFAKEVTLATLRRDKNNNPVVEREASIRGFLKAVGSPHPDKWYEEIWDLEIRLDDDLAQVWCDYAFYLGNKFSHCGVDAFQLRKGEDGWKIFHLADTRRSTNCVIPKNIQHKHTP